MNSERENVVGEVAPQPACEPSLRAIGISPERDFDLTYKQVSSMSGLSTRTVRRLVASGQLGCVRHGGSSVTIPLEEWRRYREARRVRGKAAENFEDGRRMSGLAAASDCRRTA